jgi:hypothetical protein
MIKSMEFSSSVYSESTSYAFIKSFFTPILRPAALKCIFSILYNFFFCQHRAAFLPGRVSIARVDHPLDEKIPFRPVWITIYIDFAQFWIRMITFFTRRYGRRAFIPIRDFIISMGELYAYAAQVYRKNLSTTKRPFYIARPRFTLIHLLDPHLMCIPSLHVMVVIHTYKQFIAIARKLGEEEKLKDQIEEMKLGALAISQAILFVKQHSINCIPAALYAMTCFSPDLFPPEEAASFANLLFSSTPDKNNIPKDCRVHPAASPSIKISQDDQAQIKNHILFLYRKFLTDREMSKPWYEPLLKFLREYK